MASLKKDRMFRLVDKIPLSKTPGELVEMDFLDYWDHAAFPHLQDTLPRYSIISLIGNKKKKDEHTAGKMTGATLTQSVSLFGATAIVIADKDPMYNSAEVQQFPQIVISL